jgi:hypothetical protein
VIDAKRIVALFNARAARGGPTQTYKTGEPTIDGIVAGFMGELGRGLNVCMSIIGELAASRRGE